MQLSQAVKFVDVCESLVNEIAEFKRPILTDLIDLSELQPSILDDINILQTFATSGIIPLDREEIIEEQSYEGLDYLEEAITQPVLEPVIPEIAPWVKYKDCIWRTVFAEPLMVSEEGDIWDINKNELVPQYFIDGYMRYATDGNIRNVKRTCALVCRVFGIKGTCDDGRRWIISFNDGDRRNLRPSNLRYSQQDPEDKPSPMDELIDDICQRLVQFNGDTHKVLPLYENSSPAVTKSLIDNIRTKREGRVISDKYFMFQNKQFFVRTHIQEQLEAKSTGPDIVGFFLGSGDRNFTINLINDKIKDNQKVIEREWLLAVKIIMADAKKNKKIKAPEIAEQIKSYFNKELPVDFIQELMTREDDEIYEKLGV